MKLKIFDKILLAVLVVTLGGSYLLLNSLTVFQYMFFIQIFPSILLAIIGGRLAVKSKYKWTLVFITSIIYALVTFVFISVTPMDVIEGNTIQSKTSVFTFNREIQATTYLGLFIQEYVMTAVVVIIGSILLKIKSNKF